MSLFLYVLYYCSLYDVISFGNFIHRHFFFLHACLKPDAIDDFVVVDILKENLLYWQFSL